MIKKIAVTFVALSILFISCKKDRTCSCTLSRTGTSTTKGKVSAEIIPGFPPQDLADTSFVEPLYEYQTYDKKLVKVSKSAGKNNCVSYSQPFNEVTVTSVPASSFNLSVVVTKAGEEKYDCKLK